MITFKEFLIEMARKKEARRLYHGTTIDNIPNIKSNWLTPKVGALVQKFYGDVDDPAVFMAGKSNLGHAVSAIKFHVGKKLNKYWTNVGEEDIEKHGALVLVNLDKHEHGDIYRMPSNYDSPGPKHIKYKHRISDLPFGAEPDNYFSWDSVRPSGIIKGKSLVKFLKNRWEL